MSESAVAEPEVTILPGSEAPAPESNPAVLEPPSIEAAAPSSDGSEAPEGTGSEERTTDSYPLAELDTMYREGRLTDPRLIDRRESLRNVETQRAQQAEQTRQQWAQWEAQRVQEAQTYKDRLKAELIANRQREEERAAAAGRMMDLALIEESNERTIEAHLAGLEANAQAPILAGLRSVLLHPDLYGDSAQNRAALAQMDVADLAGSIYKRALEVGRMQGPGPEATVFADKRALDKHDADVRAAVIAEVKKANPSWTVPTGPVSPSNNGEMTYEQLMKLPPEKAKALPDGLVSKIIEKAIAEGG